MSDASCSRNMGAGAVMIEMMGSICASIIIIMISKRQRRGDFQKRL